jgi:uncharacterized protein YecE (DUF72 family)
MIRVGISGWRYAPWRGVFYPNGLAQRRELEFAASSFASVEINGSFYSLQRPESYAAWNAATPDDFEFAVKCPRFISHMLRLRDSETALANFFASGIFALGHKLGPLLWQLPANFHYDEAHIEAFFDSLPRDTRAVAKLARKHDAHVAGRALVKVDANRPLRYAIEVRSETFFVPRFIDQLREHNIALVVADTAGKWPYAEDVTADFVYIRLHGDTQLYTSGYSDAALATWASRIRSWSGGTQPKRGTRVAKSAPPPLRSRDVFCYFDNDAKVKAPFDALRLASRLGIDWADAYRRDAREWVARKRS